MLNGYFDESGTHGHAKSTVIAGYVGDDKAWASVDAQWRGILHTYRLKSFHMADAIAQRGEFHQIQSYIVKDICNALANILNTSELHVVWSGVDASVWYAATNEEFRVAFPKPYDLCFLEILRQLRSWQRSIRQFGRLSMVFAAQNEYQERSAETLKAWSRYIKKGVWPLGFDSPNNLPALQAADMLVHELYVSLNTLELSADYTGKISITPLLHSASKGDVGSGGFITENALKLRVANRDWIDPYFPCPAEK